MNDQDKSALAKETAPLPKRDVQGEALAGQVNRYAFRVEGHLAPCWSEWLGGLAIAHLVDGKSLLCGPVADQAALHGLLAKLRDLNLPLISVNRLED